MYLKLKPSVIVSGGARGVDQRAHGISIRANLPTLSFIPAGLGEVYPSGFKSWVEPIVEKGGAVISQYAFEAEMRKANFLERNELIASISHAILIIEARARSGTMLTAKSGQLMNRPLGVLPHFPSTQTRGGLDLIYDGGTPIRDHLDIQTLMDQSPTRFLKPSLVEKAQI